MAGKAERAAVTYSREIERLTASVRFGLGTNAADREAMGADPRGWLADQIETSIPVPSSAVPPSAGQEAETYYRLREYERSVSDGPDAENARLSSQQSLLRLRDILSEATLDTLSTAVETQHPFRERLIRFWSNHFSVQPKNWLAKIALPYFAGTAISPFVAAPFEEMLLSVCRHPAMQIYLDSGRSTGPNSKVGLKRGLGLNENLAREILELHTLGVGGGYSQEDVIELAAALTGWTSGKPKDEETAWRFIFQPARHEPGGATLLSKTYPDKGEATAEHILRDLARHPSTAHHIATKLARHFIDDDPPDSAVDKLERRWLETQGDLGEVSRTLVTLDEARASLFSKLKQPGDLVVSSLRALDMEMTPQLAKLAARHQAAMGQPLLRPPGPQGWYDTVHDWSDPGSLSRRVDWGVALAAQTSDSTNARAAMERNFGSLVDRDNRLAIERASTRQEAAAILIASPLFQRR
ncbi:MAG: DUF1800 domain-containing protein [Parvibaculum sp.]|nr:DUF1800 domain-containing protein [Parvibaculum sp.]